MKKNLGVVNRCDEKDKLAKRSFFELQQNKSVDDSVSKSVFFKVWEFWSWFLINDLLRHTPDGRHHILSIIAL